MILVIAEKPSVAQSIAKVIGATKRCDGYMEGNNYIVSWCVGHLVGLADASSYDERYAKWRYTDLPIVPEEWLYEVPKDKAQQFKVLRDLMKDKRVSELICATDAGREGELIFRLVYNKAGCTKPFKRLWISSLEDAAIRDGFNHLRDSSDYDKLYEAALSRSKADWIVGINGTRLFTTLYNKRLVVGRVQTPTLAMLVEREGKITTFRKEKYFNIHVEKDGLTADMEKIKTEDKAKTIAAACDKKQAVVSSVRKETKSANPPKLYDLTTLQREANRYFGFTAQQTLELVQSLYEKKLLTYPRTDSQFITDDMEGTARQVISIVCRKLSIFDGLKHDPDIGRVTNNAKVTDHHAIIPTVQLDKQDIGELPQSEQKIIFLVGMRLLAATGEKHIFDETQITVICEGYEFKTKGKTVVQDGWKGIKASLNLGEVITGNLDNGVDSLLACHHDPDLASALRTDLFDDRLQIDHEVSIVTDVLTDFIHHEQKSEVLALAVNIFFDVGTELSNAEFVGLFAVKPISSCLFAHTENRLQHFNNIVFKEGKAVTGFYPRRTVDFFKLLAEECGLALLLNEAFQLGDLQVIAIEAAVIIEHLSKDAQNSGLIFCERTFDVNIEQNGLRRH